MTDTPTALTRPRRLLLVDGTNLMCRAHFAVARNPSASAGRTFLGSLARAVEQLEATHLVVALDAPGGSFRRTRLADYKGGRTTDTAAIVAGCLPYLVAARVCFVAVRGYEADDVLATLARRHATARTSVAILTGDRDALACCTDRVTVYRPMGAAQPYDEWTPARVRAEYAVAPGALADFKAIAGEKGDNVAGLNGRTAAGAVAEAPALARKLLSLHGTLEGVVDAGRDNASRDARRVYLERERLHVAREVLRLVDDAPVPLLAPYRCRATDVEWSARPTPDLVAAASALDVCGVHEGADDGAGALETGAAHA